MMYVKFCTRHQKEADVQLIEMKCVSYTVKRMIYSEWIHYCNLLGCRGGEVIIYTGEGYPDLHQSDTVDVIAIRDTQYEDKNISYHTILSSVFILNGNGKTIDTIYLNQDTSTRECKLPCIHCGEDVYTGKYQKVKTGFVCEDCFDTFYHFVCEVCGAKMREEDVGKIYHGEEETVYICKDCNKE